MITYNKRWYDIKSLVGNTWARVFVICGARGCGKTYSIQDLFLSQWKKYRRPFVWLRISKVSVDKLMRNKASDLFDRKLAEFYDLKGNLAVKGQYVYDLSIDPDMRQPMCRVMALSEYAKDKGVAHFDDNYDDYLNICLDECIREEGERVMFDLTRALSGTIENLTRTKEEKVRFFLTCNMLEDAGDVFCALNFIPEKWGRYKLRSKRAIVDIVPPSEKYIEDRKKSLASIFTPDDSNFTNARPLDRSLLYKGRLMRPQYIIKFDKGPESWFVVWERNVVCRYNKEKLSVAVAMRGYKDEMFNPMARDDVYAQYHGRCFLFRDLITQKMFEKELEALRPRG